MGNGTHVMIVGRVRALDATAVFQCQRYNVELRKLVCAPLSRLRQSSCLAGNGTRMVTSRRRCITQDVMESWKQ